MEDKILFVKQGSGEILSAKRIEAELLETKIYGEKTWRYIAPGINPFVMEGKGGLFRRMFGKPERIRFYLNLQGEPFIRDAYTGKHVDREAMAETLFQLGAIDEFGWLLHPKEKRPYDSKGILTDDEYLALRHGLIEHNNDYNIFAENEDWDRDLFTKEDVGDMEMLMTQALLIFRGKVAQGLSVSAKKSLLNARDITMWILIITCAIVQMFVFYFALKGAGYSV